MITFTNNGKAVELNSPTDMPKASSFLWNKKMMMHVNCRGYCTAQFMQPEPAKYSRGPMLEASTFMQPEQAYYAHHPGRFFYIRDHDYKTLFSIPYEPVRAHLDSYTFRVEAHKITWCIQQKNLFITVELTLATNEALELWSVTIKNTDNKQRSFSLYPYFTVGNMSWMNQSGEFNSDLNAIICKGITPYQKVDDYFKHQHFKDITFLYSSEQPSSWDVSQAEFEGEGGLHNPSSIQNTELFKSKAIYENPCAALQFDITLEANTEKSFNFVFGPAKNKEEIIHLKNTFFATTETINNTKTQYKKYIDGIKQPLQITTPDNELNQFVNHWLPRQIFYHGDINRLSTDPQTRNYLQDAMGMAYLNPKKCKEALQTALSQQHISGAMPDGILIHPDAELKYINQVPHTDHCVWLPLCLSVYLQETGDYEFLNDCLPYTSSPIANNENSNRNTNEYKTESVIQHLNRAMDFLYYARDEHGLSYIQQGDWCDPMNMVGYKGKGVSAWLCFATIYAMKQWASILDNANEHKKSNEFLQKAKECEQQANAHFWDGNWYARGITDDGKSFGVHTDDEGKIFLNPQAWAFLSQSTNNTRKSTMLEAIDTLLTTPYGVQMLAPAYTGMREDVGRVTQKHPGSAENGSVYNHAAAFYAYSLFTINETDRGINTLRKMIPGSDTSDYKQRGQLPVFIPNYYRGAHSQIPTTAGKSSQLFNTGTVHWFLRTLNDGLLGFDIKKDTVTIKPQLPTHWNEFKSTRVVRGHTFHIHVHRALSAQETPKNAIHIVYNDRTIKGVLMIDFTQFNPDKCEKYEHTIDYTLPFNG